MGSITKKPKPPSITYVNPVTPTTTVVSTPTTTTVSEPEPTDVEISTATRTGSLLRRSRGRLGTIATSFRGFLSSTAGDLNEKRKTLLGE